MHPLANSKIQKYHQNKPKFKAICSRNDSPKTKVGHIQ